MRRIRASWCGSLLGLFVAGVVLGQSPARVGDFGDPQRLVVQGAKAFSAEQVASELFGDLEVLLATHPMAPLEAYVEKLRERAIAGYRHAGFLDADVRARLDRQSGQVMLQIEEGPRYVAGDVRVAGVPLLPGAELVKRLTERRIPAGAVVSAFGEGDVERTAAWVDEEGKRVKPEDPAWKPGDPAPLAPQDMARLRKQVGEALADFGHFFAKFAIEVDREPDARTAHLVVRIDDAGPAARAEHVEIEGDQKNSREEILKYLEIKPDTVLTRRACLGMERRLWQSGRFIQHRVTPLEPEAAVEPAGLRIKLIEYPKAPRLSADLSPEEKTLLKCRDWLLKGDCPRRDVVLQMEHEGHLWELVASPDQGLLVSVRSASDADPEPQLRYALVAKPQLITCYSPSHRRKLVVPAPGMRITGSATLEVNPPPDCEERPFRLTFQLGAASAAEGDCRAPIDLTAHLAPVYFVAQAHEHDAKCSLQGNLLTVNTSTERLEVDTETGRLLHWGIVGVGEGDEDHIQMSCPPEAFQRRVEEIEREAVGWPDVFDAGRPLGSSVAFVLDDVSLFAELLRQANPGQDAGESPDEWARLAALRRLLEMGVLDPIDQWITRPDSDREPAGERFVIPEAPRPGSSDRALTDLFALLGLRGADVIFRRHSWPWQLCRESAFVVAGKMEQTPSLLKEIYDSPESGPLRLLATASLVEHVDATFAHQFATRGIERLSLADFQRDYRVLADPECLSGQCLLHVAEVVRALEPEAAELVAITLLEDDPEVFTEAARVLRDHRDRPIAEALPKALDRAWEAGLRKRVEMELRRRLMTRPPPPRTPDDPRSPPGARRV